ncbi:hypothetical protein [Catenuloplanes atrovinosus]|uniref:Uncharacterized protein n=1 Tax=Catenuloplanes atrovinosus TaxID=137266 RepID=A0AAE3YNQ2_9ACTN|nr:hypothetical protein [Catenuloplanes atrovinosus]MDR7275106.1 hypothetical protein [Catenuloplanes atrovinosus]
MQVETGEGDPGALRSPSAEASMRARWRALVLTDPVARLVRNAAFANVDDRRFDLRQLALAAVDIAVASMGFARQVTLGELLESIADLAVRMAPAAPREACAEAARWVVKGLLNDAEGQRAFVYAFTGEDGRREEFAFKLLQLQDSADGAIVQASPQAVMLYLSGLDLDVDDAEAAFSVVLRRQLRDRRFEAAGRTAAQAERVSVAMAASLTDLMEATRRDVRAVDWSVDVPRRLERAREHVESRVAEDAEVLNHVAAGIDTETDAAVRQASGELVETLRRIRQVHLDLAARVGTAHTVFIQAQLSQVFARPVHLRLLDPERELFHPVLRLPDADALPVIEAFGDRVLGLRVPRLLHLDGLVDTLLAPPRAAEPEDFDPERPGETEGVDLQSYPPSVIAEATRVLRAAGAAPVPLSSLVSGVDPGGPDAADAIELILLSALWAYAPDAAADTETAEDDGGLTALVGALAVERGDDVIDTPAAWGDDLLVRFTREETR